MENQFNKLKDNIVDLIIEHTNIYSNVKEFINNKNITMKSVDKVTDLVSKNLCDEKNKGILKDLLKTIKTVDSLNIKIENQMEIKI